VSICDIAGRLGVHPKTVSQAVKRGGPPAPRRGRRGSLLDPYRSVIDGLLAEGVWNAVVIRWEPTHESGDTTLGEQGTAYFGDFRTLHFGLDTAPLRSDRIGLGRGGRRLSLRREAASELSRPGPWAD
jgi:hypothetical protein